MSTTGPSSPPLILAHVAGPTENNRRHNVSRCSIRTVGDDRKSERAPDPDILSGCDSTHRSYGKLGRPWSVRRKVWSVRCVQGAADTVDEFGDAGIVEDERG